MEGAGVYQSREDQDQAFAMNGGPAASTATLAHDQILSAGKPVPHARRARSAKPRFDFSAARDRWSEHLCRIDLAPDLGADIGSRRWFRGLGTMVGLTAVALALWDGQGHPSGPWIKCKGAGVDLLNPSLRA